MPDETVEDPVVEDPPAEDPVVEDPPAEDPAPEPQVHDPDHVYPADPYISAYLSSTLRYKADRTFAIDDGLLTQPVACSVLFGIDAEFSALALEIASPMVRASLFYDHISQSIMYAIAHTNYRTVNAQIDKVRQPYFELEYLINRFVRENNIVSETEWAKIENASLESQLIAV